jgi:hypothetical protein
MKTDPYAEPNDNSKTPGDIKEKLPDISTQDSPSMSNLKIRYSQGDNHWEIINNGHIMTTGNKRQITDILDYIEFQSQTDQRPSSIKATLSQLFRVFKTTFKRNSR